MALDVLLEFLRFSLFELFATDGADWAVMSLDVAHEELLCRVRGEDHLTHGTHLLGITMSVHEPTNTEQCKKSKHQLQQNSYLVRFAPKILIRFLLWPDLD